MITAEPASELLAVAGDLDVSNEAEVPNPSGVAQEGTDEMGSVYKTPQSSTGRPPRSDGSLVRYCARYDSEQIDNAGATSCPTTSSTGRGSATPAGPVLVASPAAAVAPKRGRSEQDKAPRRLVWPSGALPEQVWDYLRDMVLHAPKIEALTVGRCLRAAEEQLLPGHPCGVLQPFKQQLLGAIDEALSERRVPRLWTTLLLQAEESRDAAGRGVRPDARCTAPPTTSVLTDCIIVEAVVVVDAEQAEDAASSTAGHKGGDDGSEVGATRKRVAEKGPSKPSKVAKREAARAEKKAAAEHAKEAEDGGYSMLPRGELRAQGGVIATGDARTCLPDAMSVILCMLGGVALTPALAKKTIAWFAKHVQSSRERGADPHVGDAEAFADERGFTLTHMPNVSPRILLNQRGGLFLARLAIHYSDEGVDKMDTHFVVYDATRGHIIDNLRGLGAIVIDDADRRDNRTAIAPFKEQLFPKASKVVLTSVRKAE